MEHIFTECELVIQFLLVVKENLVNHNIVNDDFVIDDEFILFGYSKRKEMIIDDALLYFIQVVKYFVYKARCEETLPNFNVFKKYFVKKYETIKFIAIKNFAMDKFEKTWFSWKNFVGETDDNV